MIKTILEASTNFCTHQIRSEYEVEDGITDTRTLIAYKVYIASDKNFMQRTSKLFLKEDESDEETLMDMSLETANLIVGSAKVIAEEANDNPYTINTPHFLKVGLFDLKYDQAKIIKVGDDEMIIAIKELDG